MVLTLTSWQTMPIPHLPPHLPPRPPPPLLPLPELRFHLASGNRDQVKHTHIQTLMHSHLTSLGTIWCLPSV